VPDNFAFYSQTYEALPEEQMRRLAGVAAFSVATNSDGSRLFCYSWSGLTITCNEMPAKEVPRHLDGFCGYVRSIYGGRPDERGKKIVERLEYTRLVIGIVAEPGRDRQGKTDELLGALAHGLDALLFREDALYDKDNRLVLGPDGSFDPAADCTGQVAALKKGRVVFEFELPPRAESDQPSMAQAARFGRARDILQGRKTPMLGYPLYIDDDDTVTLRTPAEVARRVLVLAFVTRLADEKMWRDKGLLGWIFGAGRAWAREQVKARQQLDLGTLWPHVTPEETTFVRARSFNPDRACKLLWRIEGLWVLAWALGTVELDWPAAMCDVPRLNQILADYAADPGFIAHATLRPKTEILDAVQQTMLLHWSIRNAWTRHRPVPADLDWSGQAPMIAANASPAVGVVAERHHALNWLIRFGNTDWDLVDTPT
jgi:hypothetical protein